MTCIVEYSDTHFVERELTFDLVNALLDKANDLSERYSNYILSVYVGEDNKLHLYFDGPWEC